MVRVLAVMAAVVSAGVFAVGSVVTLDWVLSIGGPYTLRSVYEAYAITVIGFGLVVVGSVLVGLCAYRGLRGREVSPESL